VGTTKGFRIYNVDPLKLVSVHEEDEANNIFKDGVARMAILYRTQILALVGSETNTRCPQEKVILYDNYQKKKDVRALL